MTEVVDRPPATARNPYVGPRSLVAGEPIHGRDRELDELRDALVADRLVLLYSPSGAGKSSLLDAGLRPALEAKEFRVSPTIRVSQHVEGATNRYVASTMLSLEAMLPPDARSSASASDAETLAEYVARIDVDRESEICLIFDQFEEVFTLDPVDLPVKAAFFAQLGELLRDRSIWAVIALREDYLAQLDPYLSLFPRRLATRMRLDFLDQRAALAAVRSPARAVGVEFTDEGAELLVDDLRTINVVRGGKPSPEKGPYVEPVQLQVVCSKLWSQLPEGADTVTRADVVAHADTDNALASFYADQVAAVAAGTGVSERVIRDWFEHSLITEQSFRAQSFEFPHERGAEVLKALEDGYLIRADSRRGVNWYELTHDRMIAPVIENNAEWRESRLNPLQMRASEWEANGRPAGLLVTGEVLSDAEVWASSSPDSTPLERDFVAASRVAENDAKAELARHEAETRKARRRSLMFAALALLAVAGLIVASFFFVSANNSKRDAQRSQRAAHASAGKAQDALDKLTDTQASAGAGTLAAQSLASASPYDAALLAVEAESRTDEPGPEPRRAWAAAVSRLARQPTLEIGGPLAIDGSAPVSMAWSPNDKVVAVATSDGGLQWFDGATHALLGKVDAPARGETLANARYSETTPISDVRWSPDGRLTIATTNGGDVRQYDAATHRLIGELAPPPPAPGVDAFAQVIPDPSGTVDAVLSGPQADMLQFTDARSGAPRGPAHSIKSVVLPPQWSPAGTRLAVADLDGTVTVWDGTSGVQVGSPISPLRQGQSSGSYIETLSWSPLGSLIAIGDSTGVVRVFDVASGRAVGDPIATLGVPTTVRFNPAQTLLAVGNHSGALSMFDVAKHVALGDPIPTGLGLTTDVAWSPTGLHLATANSDGTVRVFDGRVPFARPHQVTPGPAPIQFAAWSPDGTRVAAVNALDQIQLLDADARRTVARPFVERNGGTIALDWSPDSRFLVTSNGDGSMHVIRADSGAEYGEPLGSTTSEPSTSASAENAPAQVFAHDVAWNPNGTVIAAAMDDSSVRLYDATTRMLIGQAATTAQHGTTVAVRWNPDGTVLATKNADGTVRLFDMPSLHLRGESTVEGGASNGLWWSPDGNTLAVAGVGVQFLDDKGAAVGGEPLYAGTGGATAVSAAAWSPDSNAIAVGTNDGSMQLYDPTTHQLWADVLAPNPNGYLGWIAWSPDGATLAASTGDAVPSTFSAWPERSVCEYLKGLLSAARMDELVADGGATSTCAHGEVTDTAPLPIADHALP